MPKLKAILLAGTIAIASPFSAVMAQEIVNVAGVEATRVVIAPPRTELARIINAGLSEAYADTQKGTRAYAQTQKLYFFYGSRHFEPLWLSQGADGKVVFSENAEKIIDVFKKSELEGFRPAAYEDLVSTIVLRTGVDVSHPVHELAWVGLSYFHVSNGGLSDHNPGAESLVMSISRALDW